MFRKSKSRKNGPLKALPAEASTKTKKSSKDDIAMGQVREKLKANPYATIKMWRPVSMSSNSWDRHPLGEETNFDFLRHDSDTDLNKGRLPVTGHVMSTDKLTADLQRKKLAGEWNSSDEGQGNSNHSLSDWVAQGEEPLYANIDIPVDYMAEPSSQPQATRVSSQPQATRVSSQPQATRVSSQPQATRVNAPPTNQATRVNAPPTSANPNLSIQQKSLQLVSDGATSSIREVLSHRYTHTGSDVDLAARDIDRLVADLRLTLDTLKGSRIDKNPTQLSMCVTELQTQTQTFILNSKHLVASASKSRDDLAKQLDVAMHTLALLFLHGQATMLMVKAPVSAEQLGHQIIRAANSFKSTVMAASSAVGRAVEDPNTKYLVKQSINLVQMLSALVKSVKDIQQGNAGAKGNTGANQS